MDVLLCWFCRFHSFFISSTTLAKKGGYLLFYLPLTPYLITNVPSQDTGKSLPRTLWRYTCAAPRWTSLRVLGPIIGCILSCLLELLNNSVLPDVFFISVHVQCYGYVRKCIFSFFWRCCEQTDCRLLFSDGNELYTKWFKVGKCFRIVQRALESTPFDSIRGKLIRKCAKTLICGDQWRCCASSTVSHRQSLRTLIRDTTSWWSIPDTAGKLKFCYVWTEKRYE